MNVFNKEDIKVLEEFKKDGVKWFKCECPKHGYFEKRKHDFLRSSYGCQKCGGENTDIKYKKDFSILIEKSKKIYGDIYTFPDAPESYYNNDKIDIFCKKHKIKFAKEVTIFLKGHGCPECTKERLADNKQTTEDIVKKCIEKRGTEKYDYSKVIWDSKTEKINVICKKHGEFTVRYYDFLKGINCQKCAKELQTETLKKTWEAKGKEVVFDNNDFIRKAKKVHPEYDYSKTIYENRNKSVIIIYEGKEYTINPRNLLKGCKPLELTFKERGEKKAQLRWKNIKEELLETHNNKYQYLQEEIDFIKTGKAERTFVMHIICPEHGVFKQTFFDHRYGHGCKKCAIENRPINNISAAEKEIVEFIKTFYDGNIEQNNRKILKGKELDVYFPDLKLAIEYDGLFWHNNIDNSYKFEECKKQGIRLIRITEPEWLKKQNKIKSFLKATFGVFEKKVYARKCIIKEIDKTTYKNFCDENHLQGYSPASVLIGLFFKNQLIQIMSFGKPRFEKKAQWELIRECSKLDTAVVGGKEKLLKFFERTYKPKNILSYCEKDKFSGSSYYKSGFNLTREGKPSYVYYYGKNYKPFSRITFQKSKLKKKLDIFDENLTEWENMKNNGYRRLFDYGTYVFTKTIEG